MSNNHFTEKYSPKSIKEIIGNKSSISKFDKWIKSINDREENFLILSGKNGIGKTIISSILLDTYNYNPIIIYPEDIKNYRQNDEFNDFYNLNNSINKKINFKNVENKNIALLFDDTETITLTSEKKYIMNIFKNKINSSIPIIFICNNNHSKLLNDLKKNCQEIKFYSPSSYDLKNFIKTICNKEKIKIDNEDSLDILVELSQYDIRRLLNLIEDFNYNYKTLSTKNIEKFKKQTLLKDTNIGLYDATKILLNDDLEFDNIYKIYESEKVLLPLMIQENYYKKICNSKNSVKEKLDSIVSISDSISFGDNVETSIYTDQNWYLQEIHGFFTCIKPSKISNEFSYKVLSNLIQFSSDLNKTSLKNINKKNINNLQKIIGNKSIEEILILCKLTNYCFEKKEYTIIIDILKNYKSKLDIKDIELCLKINKTIDFITLKTKDKKKIIKLF
jgi:DNA polymerase III delta prime subunit